MAEVDISVIIPVYQTPRKILKRSVESVLQQSGNLSTEVLLIIDGVEGNEQALEDWDRTVGVRVVPQQHAGVAAARNRGIAEASGNWILFLDADDFLPDSSFIDYWERVQGTDADMVFANHFRIYGDESQSIVEFTKDTVLHNSDHINLVKIVLSAGTDQGTVWGKLFRRDFLRNNQLLFDKTLTNGEDQEFMVKCSYVAKTTLCIESFCYAYIYNPNSAVRKYNPHYAQACTRTLEAVQKDLHSFEQDNALTAIFAKYCLDRLLLIIINNIYNPHSGQSNKQKRTQIYNLSQTTPFKQSIKLKYIRTFPIAKQITLYLVKYKCYFGVKFIAYLRHRQLSN